MTNCHSNIIVCDTREKPKAIVKLTKQIEDMGYKIIRSKMYVGDYKLIDNPYIVVDRKQNLQELIGNVTHDHQRFKNEIQRANDIGVKVYVLVEHSNQVHSIDDLRFWHNPRLKVSPRATTGMTLIKILKTMEMLYDVQFLFCSKKQTGTRIIEILERGYDETIKNKRIDQIKD